MSAEAGTLTSADIEAARTHLNGECTCEYTPVGPDRFVRPVTDEHCPVHVAIRPVYPNREHRNADRAARRRAHKALDDIEAEVGILRRRLKQADNPLSSLDGDDTQLLAGKVRDLTSELSVMATLRYVREWARADRETAEQDAERAWQRWLAEEADDAIAGVAQAGSEEAKGVFMDAFLAARGAASWMDGEKGR
jgi:hypothetical protein